MKNNYLFFILLLSGSIYSQKQHYKGVWEHFNVDNSELIWQKVYESDLSAEEIKDIMYKNSILSPISDNLSGYSNPFFLINCEQHGIMPQYTTSEFTIYAEIEHKPGRFRVTVRQIKFVLTPDLATVYDKRLGTFINIEDYQVMPDGTLNPKKQAQKGLNCLNSTFTNLFSFKKSSIKSDW